ncbi:hypothetical protein RRG08_059353 [Elysia crispata]|uniref:Uncharacterized protein n=1 Tax=Elysia crispata TaxID=231223 RepID=A0AAE1BDM2_9GAST|nr:hypothetical protein RRG08_059353 [Elysia crispata]
MTFSLHCVLKRHRDTSSRPSHGFANPNRWLTKTRVNINISNDPAPRAPACQAADAPDSDRSILIHQAPSGFPIGLSLSLSGICLHRELLALELYRPVWLLSLDTWLSG